MWYRVPGQKTPGARGEPGHTRDTHGTRGRTRAHGTHTDKPHIHPNPTTHPHDHATAETVAGSAAQHPQGRPGTDRSYLGTLWKRVSWYAALAAPPAWDRQLFPRRRRRDRCATTRKCLLCVVVLMCSAPRSVSILRIISCRFHEASCVEHSIIDLFAMSRFELTFECLHSARKKFQRSLPSFRASRGPRCTKRRRPSRTKAC